LTGQQLDHIKHLIAQAQFPDALQELKTLESSEQLTSDNRLTLRYLQSTLFLNMGRFKEGLQVAEQLLEDIKIIGDPLLELNALINIIWAVGCLGKLDEGLHLARRGEKLLKILEQTHHPELKGRQAAFLHRKGSILYSKGEQEKGLNLQETSLALKEEIGDKNGVIESLYDLPWYFMYEEDPDSLLEHGQKILTISEVVGDQQGIGKANTVIGWYYETKGDLDHAKKYLQKSLTIFETIDDQFNLAESLHNIARIYLSRGNLNQALETYQKSLPLKEATGHQNSIASVYNAIGVVHEFKGELDHALEYYQQSLALFEAMGNLRLTALLFNNIGCVLGRKSDFEAATNYFERSLKISRRNSNWLTADSLYQQIRYFVDMLPPETVESYLAELEEINKRLGDQPRINQRYRLATAIVLKAHGRLVDKTTAQTIFQQIAAENIVVFELSVEALINLSELLLLELKTLGSDLALIDLKQVIQKLATIAKNQNSHWVLAESLLLQAKLALMDLDVIRAEELLIQGELLATEKELLGLTRAISAEREILRTQSDKWKRIIEQRPSISEIIKLTQIDDLISRVIHKQRYDNEEELKAYAENARQLVNKWEKT
jgi:tetratricopeptide (TPR) repeat protein